MGAENVKNHGHRCCRTSSLVVLMVPGDLGSFWKARDGRRVERDCDRRGERRVDSLEKRTSTLVSSVGWRPGLATTAELLVDNRSPALQALRGSQETEGGGKGKWSSWTFGSGPNGAPKARLWSPSPRTMEFSKESAGIGSIPYSG